MRDEVKDFFNSFYKIAFVCSYHDPSDKRWNRKLIFSVHNKLYCLTLVPYPDEDDEDSISEITLDEILNTPKINCFWIDDVISDITIRENEVLCDFFHMTDSFVRFPQDKKEAIIAVSEPELDKRIQEAING